MVPISVVGARCWDAPCLQAPCLAAITRVVAATVTPAVTDVDHVPAIVADAVEDVAVDAAILMDTDRFWVCWASSDMRWCAALAVVRSTGMNGTAILHCVTIRALRLPVAVTVVMVDARPAAPVVVTSICLMKGANMPRPNRRVPTAVAAHIIIPCHNPPLFNKWYLRKEKWC